MGYFNDHARQLARKRSAKRGAESLGALLAIVVAPIYAMYWIFKIMFWIFIGPFVLIHRLFKR